MATTFFARVRPAVTAVPDSPFFGQQPRRGGFPWGWLLIVAVLAGVGWWIYRTCPQQAWESVQALIPASDSGPPPADPDAPVVPLPVPPPN